MSKSERRLFEDEPLIITNAHADQASKLISALDARGGVKKTSEVLQAAQAQASLAVAQEVKNLRVYLQERDAERAMEEYHRGQ